MVVLLHSPRMAAWSNAAQAAQRDRSNYAIIVMGYLTTSATPSRRRVFLLTF